MSWRSSAGSLGYRVRIQSSDTKAGTMRRSIRKDVSETERRAPRVPAVPPDCPSELVERMGADVRGQAERSWPKRQHASGPCLTWTGVQYRDRPYGRMYDATLKRS